MWIQISEWFGLSKPWRYVANGRCLYPSWLLQGFAIQSEDGVCSLKVCMILGAHGGGPLNFRSVSQVRSSETSGMLTHMADFEAENFEAALRHVLQKLVLETDVRMHIDIAQFLELEMAFVHGLLCVKGD